MTSISGATSRRALTFEFEPQTSPVEGGNAYRQDLEIVEATRKADGVVGIARNQTDEQVSGPFSVIGVCFDQSGAIQGYYAAYAAKDQLAPGETTPFNASFYGTGPVRRVPLGSQRIQGGLTVPDRHEVPCAGKVDRRASARIARPGTLVLGSQRW